MTFVHPFAALLLALVAVPVLLYILPMPRKRVVMPSLILWQRMMRDRPASQSWRWLRTLLSCLLQVLILLLLVLAVGKPVFRQLGSRSRTAILVLDVSASMTAPFAGGTRFDEAHAVARRTIEELPPGARAAIVTAGTSPRVVCGPTDQRSVVLERLSGLSDACTEGRTDLAAALRVAIELAHAERNAEITVISDGAADVSKLVLGDVRVHYLPVGTSVPNVGIVDFRARAGLDYPDECQALVRLHSTFDASTQVALSLSMDDDVVATATVTVPPNATVERNFPDLDAGEKPIKLTPGWEGRFKAAIDTVDGFACDDTAWALLGVPQKLRVLLVNDVPDRFLRSVLKANLNVEAFGGTMAQYLAGRPPADIAIFNGKLPDALPASHLLLINPDASCPLFDVAGEVKDATVSDWQRDHPLLANITLKDVFIPAARVVKPAAWMTVLAEAAGTPLLLAGRESGRRVVVMTFDPGKSSLSFRVAFPVLVANAFAWLSDQADLTERETVSGGELRLKPAAAVETLDVTGPGDGTFRVQSRAGELPVATDRVGVYRASLSGRDMTFVANLTDVAESTLEVAPELKFADRSVAGHSAGEPEFEDTWLIAAVAAFGLLAVEWYLYHHRLVV